ncbi:MAG: RidA family protein [Rhodobacteraceae bacterium]|nr:RidA family protein [Paracoccaceae bacterium]
MLRLGIIARAIECISLSLSKPISFPAANAVAIDPVTGELDTKDIVCETERVVNNIRAILKEANYLPEQVVKCSIFLSDMAHFETVNRIYATLFNEKTAPARETVAVLGLPKNVNVEISLIAQK